jgi:DNA-directed RNA polymerase specialized sigma24 family protein
MQLRALYLQNRRADIEGDFWQQWNQNRDHLYRCCIKWMGGNYADAEDALSRAMLKAWKKTQKDQGKITNYKAWLTRLTHNLCVDIHQERDRTAHRVENIDAIAHQEEQGKIFQSNTPARIRNRRKKNSNSERY